MAKKRTTYIATAMATAGQLQPAQRTKRHPKWMLAKGMACSQSKRCAASSLSICSSNGRWNRHLKDCEKVRAFCGGCIGECFPGWNNRWVEASEHFTRWPKFFNPELARSDTVGAW